MKRHDREVVLDAANGIRRADGEVAAAHGDDAEAKAVATAFLESTGWRVRDLGDLERSRKFERELLVWAAGRPAR